MGAQARGAERSPHGPSRTPRVAVLGGDGRFRRDRLPGCRVRVFPGSRTAGNGPMRRLEQSLRAGGVDRVVILTRWLGHSASNRALRLCRQLDVPYEFVR